MATQFDPRQLDQADWFGTYYGLPLAQERVKQAPLETEMMQLSNLQQALQNTLTEQTVPTSKAQNKLQTFQAQAGLKQAFSEEMAASIAAAENEPAYRQTIKRIYQNTGIPPAKFGYTGNFQRDKEYATKYLEQTALNREQHLQTKDVLGTQGEQAKDLQAGQQAHERDLTDIKFNQSRVLLGEEYSLRDQSMRNEYYEKRQLQNLINAGDMAVQQAKNSNKRWSTDELEAIAIQKVHANQLADMYGLERPYTVTESDRDLYAKASANPEFLAIVKELSNTLGFQELAMREGAEVAMKKIYQQATDTLQYRRDPQGAAWVDRTTRSAMDAMARGESAESIRAKLDQYRRTNPDNIPNPEFVVQQVIEKAGLERTNPLREQRERQPRSEPRAKPNLKEAPALNKTKVTSEAYDVLYGDSSDEEILEYWKKNKEKIQKADPMGLFQEFRNRIPRIEAEIAKRRVQARDQAIPSTIPGQVLP